jgi:hypothetical protein
MKTAEERAKEAEYIERMGLGTYSYVKHFPDGECAWIARMAFTTAILYGLDTHGHRDRWCYETAAAARRALDDWDGKGEPKDWHRHPPSGRRKDEAGNEYVRI